MPALANEWLSVPPVPCHIGSAKVVTQDQLGHLELALITLITNKWFSVSVILVRVALVRVALVRVALRGVHSLFVVTSSRPSRDAVYVLVPTNNWLPARTSLVITHSSAFVA